jgi:hypothetical protein
MHIRQLNKQKEVPPVGMILKGNLSISSDDHPESLLADLEEAVEQEMDVRLSIGKNTYHIVIEDLE